MVQRVRVPSTTNDEAIQKRLTELYSSREREQQERARGQLTGQQFCEESVVAILCTIESSVKLERGFKNLLRQQVSEDDEYEAIVQKLQDPAEPNEVQDQSQRKFRIKEGILKIHQEEQNTAYSYWRIVIPDQQDIKMQILREIRCVPYS